MRYQSLMVVLTTLVFSTATANADVPANVRCALLAQKKARNGGAEYRQLYNRTFELCMVSSMPRERQTDYFIEKLKPYVAISPGPPTKSEISAGQKIGSRKPKSIGTWVRMSPNVWVLDRE